jgi:hypothetical protein
MFLFILPAILLHQSLVSAADATVLLRDLAKPRWFGTAANTTFLYNDQVLHQLG